jgi:hypothetical protein
MGILGRAQTDRLSTFASHTLTILATMAMLKTAAHSCANGTSKKEKRKENVGLYSKQIRTLIATLLSFLNVLFGKAFR